MKTLQKWRSKWENSAKYGMFGEDGICTHEAEVRTIQKCVRNNYLICCESWCMALISAPALMKQEYQEFQFSTDWVNKKYLCTCACLCVHACTCFVWKCRLVGLDVPWHVCGVLAFHFVILRKTDYPPPLRWCLLLTFSSLIRLDWLAGKPQGTYFLRLPCAGITNGCHFNMAFSDWAQFLALVRKAFHQWNHSQCLNF